MPETPSSSLEKSNPDYAGLVRFLVEPFLDSPTSLSIDCERSPSKGRVWIRLAFEAADKGRVFGRGGRNIQAIRMVIQSIAQAAGQSAHLDIYESQAGTASRDAGNSTAKRTPPRQSTVPKPAPKIRSE